MKKAIRKPLIVVPLGTPQKMAEVFNVTAQSVYDALNYSSNSEKAMKIRKEALELYGGVSTEKVVFQ